jgi:hypothetical protein
MTNEELLLREGAAYFGNRLLYKNQDVGVTAPGVELVLFAEGEAFVARLKDITDVVAKPSREKKAKTDSATPVVVDVIE